MPRQPLQDKVRAVMPGLTAMRRSFHKYPELSGLEFRTAALAARRMRELGFTLTLGEKAADKTAMRGVPAPEILAEAQKWAVANGADPGLVTAMNGGMTGFWADLDCGPGPCFAIRTDMDALEVTESASPDHRPAREGFASTRPGIMHACGHDAHVAMSVAVAEILASMKGALRGRFRVIFEPGEEKSLGAAPMVAAGCLDGVNAIAGVHVGFQAARKGHVVCGTHNFLACVGLDVTYAGKAAHAGAAPQEGKNALLAACAAVSDMLAIPRHGNGATRINVGKMVAGQGRNIIPPHAELILEARGHTMELARYAADEARRICRAAGDMWDCRCDIVMTENTPSARSSKSMLERVARIAREIPGFTNVIEEACLKATEDYSHMINAIQKTGGEATYIQIGVDRAAGHHNEAFDFDERNLSPGVELLTRLALECLARSEK